LVLVGFVGDLEKESWGALASAILEVVIRLHALGRFSSSIATYHVLEGVLCGFDVYARCRSNRKFA
jgi:hypothetical protein